MPSLDILSFSKRKRPIFNISGYLSIAYNLSSQLEWFVEGFATKKIIDFVEVTPSCKIVNL